MAAPQIVVKYPKQLKDGDHVFVRRCKLKWQRKIVDGTPVEQYLYSHHGIYDATNHRVIEFGDPDDEKLPDKQPVQEAGPCLRTMFANVVGKVTELHKSKIIFRDPIAFTFGNGKIRVYSYLGKTPNQELPAEDSITGDSIDGMSPDTEQIIKSVELQGQNAPRSHAADIARWFYEKQSKEPVHSFLRYNVFKSNCEHFATLCKTLRLDLDQLEVICREKSVNGKTEMKDWANYSLCRSLQAERFLNGARGWLDQQASAEVTVSTDVEQASGTASADDGQAALISSFEDEDCEIEEYGDEDDS
ncbi:uncharacterized protein LOC135809841 isoform X2 [Sycon ciliatum]